MAITNTQDMSSLYGFGLHMDGRQMSASFNFNDLYQDPVPQEIYESQPRCWRSSRAAKGGRYRPLPSDYPGCARTLPYEPIIVIPAEVRDLDPEWANCKGGIEGVYDPPGKCTFIVRNTFTSYLRHPYSGTSPDRLDRRTHAARSTHH